jgi:2-keto-4-pentenoate hydratase
VNIEEIAQNLQNARLLAKPIATLKENLDLNSAKEILREGINLRKLKGEELTGYVIQKENYFSYLTNQMNLIPGSNFSLKDCISPIVSAHFVYYIDSAIKRNSSLEQMIEATSSIGMAILVSDSRYEKGQIVSIQEQIADNFFSSYYFLGRKRLDFKEMKDRPVRVAFYFDNEKKLENEILDLSFGLSQLKNIKDLDLKPSSLLLSPNLFDFNPLSSNMDISLVADYFGATTFKVI